MSEETTDRQDEFFPFDDERDDVDGARGDEGRARRTVAWKSIAVGLVGIVLGLVLAVSGALAWDESRRLAGYADRSWVISGQYRNLTNDLRTETYNPVYSGVLPTDEAVTEQPFDSGLADPSVPEPGQQTLFRGTQRGDSEDDFHQEVDALLAVEDGTLQVVETVAAGQYGEGITAGTITWQRIQAVLLLVAGIGVAGTAFWYARRLYREQA